MARELSEGRTPRRAGCGPISPQPSRSARSSIRDASEDSTSAGVASASSFDEPASGDTSAQPRPSRHGGRDRRRKRPRTPRRPRDVQQHDPRDHGERPLLHHPSLADTTLKQGDSSSTVGSLVGAVALEEAARHGQRPFVNRFPRFARQDPAKLANAERWFERRGWLMVLAGRCEPGVRSLVALPAGVLRMPRGEYVVLTLIGSTVWNALLIGAGYVLGAQWARVADAIGPLAVPALVVALLAVVGVILWRARRRRRTAPPADGDAANHQ